MAGKLRFDQPEFVKAAIVHLRIGRGSKSGGKKARHVNQCSTVDKRYICKRKGNTLCLLETKIRDGFSKV